MYYTVRVWGAISTDFISRSDLSAQRSVSFTRRWRRPRWKPPSIYTGNEALAVISAHASSRLFFSFLSSLFFISLFLSCSILFFFSSMELLYISVCIYTRRRIFFFFFFPPLVLPRWLARNREEVVIIIMLLQRLEFSSSSSLYLGVYIIMSFGPASSMSFNAFKVCNTRDPVGACFSLCAGRDLFT